jgi:hypothetical protein
MSYVVVAADIFREQERSNSANVIFRTALGKHDALEARLLGLGGPSPGPFFWRAGKKMEFLIGVFVGFVLGYGVREAILRYRRARAFIER